MAAAIKDLQLLTAKWPVFPLWYNAGKRETGGMAVKVVVVRLVLVIQCLLQFPAPSSSP